MATDKALAVMTLTEKHLVAIDSIAMFARQVGSATWFRDNEQHFEIREVVRYLVEHPERLAGEGQVIVDKKEIRERMFQMAGPSGGLELKRIEDAYLDMQRWLTQERPV